MKQPEFFLKTFEVAMKLSAMKIGQVNSVKASPSEFSRKLTDVEKAARALDHEIASANTYDDGLPVSTGLGRSINDVINRINKRWVPLFKTIKDN